jgi:hypothetical protein
MTEGLVADPCGNCMAAHGMPLEIDRENSRPAFE